MKTIYMLMMYVMVLVSCTRENFPKEIMGKYDVCACTEEGFYSNDGVRSLTVQSRYQTSMNDKRMTYRVQDNDQETFIHVQFDQKPDKVGQVVDAEILSKVSFKVGSTERMKVIKAENGMIWMSGEDISIILPAFK